MDDRFITRSRNGLSDGAYSGNLNTIVAACNTTDYEACYKDPQLYRVIKMKPLIFVSSI